MIKHILILEILKCLFSRVHSISASNTHSQFSTELKSMQDLGKESWLDSFLPTTSLEEVGGEAFYHWLSRRLRPGKESNFT